MPLPTTFDDPTTTWDSATVTWDDVTAVIPAVFPTFSIEVAFGEAPLSRPTSGWLDVSTYVRGFSVRRGRTHELNRTQAGELTLNLSNKDRRFDPSNAASPYWPNVVPMAQVRVTANFGGTEYPVFWGFVEDWGQEWQPRPLGNAGDAETVVRAVDAFKMLGLYQLTPYSTVVLSDEPLVYYRLQELALPVADEGSVGSALVKAGTTVGPGEGTAPLVGGAPSMRFTGIGRLEDAAPPEDLAITGDVTVEAWVRIDGTILSPDHPLVGTKQTIVRHGGTVKADYELLWDTDAFTGGLKFRADTSSTVYPDDGQVRDPAGAFSNTDWHHLVGVRSDRDLYLYKDGALLASSRRESSVEVPATPLLNVGDDPVAGSYFVGDVAHVAIYSTALSPERITAHYEAGFDTFVQQATGAHVDAILDVIDWPTGAARSIDTGASMIQATTPTGSTLDWLLQVAEDSERGLFVTANDGVLEFHDRHRLLLDNLTSSGTYGDSNAETVSYADLQIRNDDGDLWTSVQVAREGGSVSLVTDPTAEATYGPRTLDISGSLVATDEETRDQANYLLVRYSVPTPRVERLTLIPARDAVAIAAALSLDCNHNRITVIRRPPGGGAPISQDVYVEGVQLDYLPQFDLVLAFDLIPADTILPIIFDDPVTGKFDGPGVFAY